MESVINNKIENRATENITLECYEEMFNSDEETDNNLPEEDFYHNAGKVICRNILLNGDNCDLDYDVGSDSDDDIGFDSDIISFSSDRSDRSDRSDSIDSIDDFSYDDSCDTDDYICFESRDSNLSGNNSSHTSFNNLPTSNSSICLYKLPLAILFLLYVFFSMPI